MSSLVTAGWVASNDRTEHYLQVDFEVIYDVTALQFTRSTLGYGTRKLRYTYIYTFMFIPQNYIHGGSIALF